MQENYVVRIYRCEKGKPHSLVGVVEKVGVKGRMAFTSFDELWEILNLRKKGGSERGKRRRGEREKGGKGGVEKG